MKNESLWKSLGNLVTKRKSRFIEITKSQYGICEENCLVVSALVFYFTTQCGHVTNHVLFCYPLWAYDQSCFTLLFSVSIWPIMFFGYPMWACDQLYIYIFCYPMRACDQSCFTSLFSLVFFVFFHVRTFLEWPNLVHKLISKGEINISETGLHSLLVALG